MTASPYDLRRPVRLPIDPLLRAAAVCAAASVPLVWAVTAWRPFGPEPCGRLCPGVLVIYDAVYRAILVVGCLELAAITTFALVTVVRGMFSAGAALHRFAVAVGVIALALGACYPMADGTGSGVLAILFVFWVAAPLVLYAVHRIDPRSVIPVLLGLTPGAGVCILVALDGDALACLPTVMLLAIACFVGLRRALIQR